MGGKKYRLNPVTLSFEAAGTPLRLKVLRWFVMFLLSLGLALLYFWIYSSVLGLKSPKRALLETVNARWNSRISLLDNRMSSVQDALEAMQQRDDDVYRPIFGMNEIHPEARNAGMGGQNRYGFIADLPDGSALGASVLNVDRMKKKAYIQSKSFDEVFHLALKAGDMASCVPCIPPINPDHSTFRFSSPFGYRADPKLGYIARHTGIDLACDKGNPVYATGDGVVETVRSELTGYGNFVLINHGFGYKTRYAHLKSYNVIEGMKVKRGENIGFSGNSGKSTGPHLHYEVIYRDGYVNPLNYMDLSMSTEDYFNMVKKVDGESEKAFTRPKFVRKH